MVRSLLTAASVLLILPAVTPTSHATEADQPPNIVFIMADDLGYDRVETGYVK